MNEKLLTFLHYSTIAIILICIALFIAYLVPSKEPYNKNKVAEINKDLQPFSSYSTSLTTPKEVNTLDTTDSVDEYCGALNKDACNTADEMCVYDGLVCNSRKYNYNVKQTQIIGSVNSFHNSKDGKNLENDLITHMRKHCQEKLFKLKDEYIHTQFGKELALPLHNELFNIVNDTRSLLVLIDTIVPS